MLLLLIYLSFISLGLQDLLLGAAWPSMYITLNVPLHYAGFISMTISAGTVIASISSAYVIKRFGTGRVMIFCVLATAASLLGISFTNSFISLCLLAVPLGLGAGSVDAALNNYVALHYKARHMNWLHCFWGIGAFIGPAIMASFLINNNSWNFGYRTIGIFQICLVALLIAAYPLWIRKKSSDNGGQQPAVNFKKILSIAGVKQALISFFCYCGIEITMGIWGTSYLVTVKETAPEIAAIWLSFFYLGITLGRFISGFLTIKIRNRQMIRIGQVIVICAVIIMALPYQYSALAGFFIIGLGCAPIFPCMLHETPANFGIEYSQAMIGIQMGCAYIGTSLMPPLFGWLSSFAGFKIFPLFIGIMLIIKIIMTEILNKKVDKRKMRFMESA
ncbi:MAG: MFS transporter [Treponema sp.]|nr:MFS transporter [Treponema sp.]